MCSLRYHEKVVCKGILSLVGKWRLNGSRNQRRAHRNRFVMRSITAGNDNQRLGIFLALAALHFRIILQSLCICVQRKSFYIGLGWAIGILLGFCFHFHNLTPSTIPGILPISCMGGKLDTVNGEDTRLQCRVNAFLRLVDDNECTVWCGCKQNKIIHPNLTVWLVFTIAHYGL